MKTPSVKGWRIAWATDLGGLMTIDDEVRAVFERAVGVFRAAGARVERGRSGPERGAGDRPAHPRAPDGRAPRGQACRASRRSPAGAGREHRAGPGAHLRRGGTRRAPAHAAVAAGAGLSSRPRSLAHADLGHAAVSRRAAARRRDQRPTGRQGDAAVVSHLRVLGARPAGDLDPVRLHERGAAGGPADRRQAPRRGGRAAGGRGVREPPSRGRGTCRRSSSAGADGRRV